MEDYFYELKYKNGNNEINYKFNADLELYQIQDHIQRFLLSCGWVESQLKDMFIQEE